MTCSKWVLPLLFALLLAACGHEQTAGVEATRTPEQEIIDAAIAWHGGELYSDSGISFQLRDRNYSISRAGGLYKYTSTHRDSTGLHRRELTNLGFTEWLNGTPVGLSPKDSLAHAESVNSVVYFALLPYLLNDPAVQAKLEGTDTLSGKVYHRMRVSFTEDGGGIDFDDVYYYWFDVEDHSLDFLAYSFYVNGGGSRFRKAVNVRRVNGIIFQDYENFKGPAPDSLAYIAGMWQSGELPLLSTIALSKIAVSSADE